MVATNRLTGHSPGFFSVYTLPPNQAVIAGKPGQDQREARTETAIPRRTRADPQEIDAIAECDQCRRPLATARGPPLPRSSSTGEADATAAIPDDSVQLTVTSPPFLDVVQYAQDNWLRCWFNGFDAEEIGTRITMSTTLEDWSARDARASCTNSTASRGPAAGWRSRSAKCAAGRSSSRKRWCRWVWPLGFACEAILINAQHFTKTANIWGVQNNQLGTNSNRIVLFRKR